MSVSEGEKIIRVDWVSCVIKVRTEGQYSHGWAVLERCPNRHVLKVRLKELRAQGYREEDDGMLR